MTNVCFAPHLDDEIIGCFSVLKSIDIVVYWHLDYRAAGVMNRPDWFPVYVSISEYKPPTDVDNLYIPSKYDLHPLHREVHIVGLSQVVRKKWFYSVEMNVPWLELEEDSESKRELFREVYPEEVQTIEKNDKYFLFKSIKPFDEFIWASIRFEYVGFHRWPDALPEVVFLRNLHRHKFFFQVDVQQFGDDRDLEYFLLSEEVQGFVRSGQWAEYTSCEMFARSTRDYVMKRFPDRRVRVSVREDDENGCVLEE